jgi:hypothetical protein
MDLFLDAVVILAAIKAIGEGFMPSHGHDTQPRIHHLRPKLLGAHLHSGVAYSLCLRNKLIRL